MDVGNFICDTCFTDEEFLIYNFLGWLFTYGLVLSVSIVQIKTVRSFYVKAIKARRESRKVVETSSTGAIMFSVIGTFQLISLLRNMRFVNIKTTHVFAFTQIISGGASSLLNLACDVTNEGNSGYLVANALRSTAYIPLCALAAWATIFLFECLSERYPIFLKFSGVSL